MTIALLPTPPSRNMVPSDFVTAMNNFLAAMPQFVTDANTLAANLNSIAAGGAYAIPYVFSTGAVAGSTNMCAVDNSVAPAHLYLNRVLAGGLSVDAILQTFDDSTSSNKGKIRLFKQGDASKWALFNTTGLTTYAGYVDCAVSSVQYSTGTTAFPFADGDAIMLQFTPNGDKGQTGGSYLNLANVTVSSPVANIDFLNIFNGGYDKYVIEIQGAISSSASPDQLFLRLAKAGVVETGVVYTQSGSAANSFSFVPIAGNGNGIKVNTSVDATIQIKNANSTSARKTVGSTSSYYVYSNSVLTSVIQENSYDPLNVVTGFRLYWNTGANFQAGAIVRVFGLANS